MAVTDQNISLNMQVGFGLQENPAQLALNYSESITTTAKYLNNYTETIAANTTNNQVDLATIFAGITEPIAFGMQVLDESPGNPVNWGLASSGTRFGLGATGALLIRLSPDETLPTLYIDNPSLTLSTTLLFTVMGD